MPNTTPNLGLIKPLVTEQYDIAKVTNENADKIDLLLAPKANPTFTGVVTASQIKFPATQVPSSDPNTLDDYEEGSFTPILYGIGSAGTTTYNVRFASYTKVGRSVSFQIYLEWSSHTGSGGMRLSGLPFLNLANQLASLNISYVHNVTMNAGKYLGGYIDGNFIVFVSNAVGGGTVTPFDVSANGAIMISGTYLTT